MKSIFSLYASLLFPWILIMILEKYGYISQNLLLYLVAVHALIYHPLICGLRLIANNKIPRSSFWKNFIPMWNLKYRYFLFFNDSIPEYNKN